ncbi:MAG: type II toxin-antitoxin system RelE/ParE family toxin [Rhodospirillaceae bacterium]|nr:type II toxin-antitoxin system RelE/ParE family toxin [Rhodospirillaceae bacterium]
MVTRTRSIFYKPRARKPLLRMPRPQARQIRQDLERIAAGMTGDADLKPLRGRRGFYRLRVGDWRAVIEVTDDMVMVWLVGSRGQVYKDLAAMGL